MAAPEFLDKLVKQFLAETNEPEESNLAAESHHTRTQTVSSLIRHAGFNISKTDWYGHQAIIDTPEEFWDIQRTFSSFSRKRLSAAKPPEIDSLHDKFLEICRKTQSQGGQMVYPFGAFYVVATRPE